MSAENIHTQTEPLFANLNSWRSMGSRFSGEHLHLQTEDLVGAGLLIGAFVIGILVLRFAAKYQATEERNSPRKLFRDLCKAHHLDRPVRGQLRRAAAALELSDPTGLFVRPDLLERQPVVEAIGEESTQALRSRLFG